MPNESLAKLTAEVAENKTVMESAATLLSGLSARLVEVAGDQEATLALANELDTNSNALAEAITANTPEAPAPTV